MSAALKGSIAAGLGTRTAGANVLRRKVFAGQAVSVAMPRKHVLRKSALVVRAFEDEDEEPREWPYPKFVEGDNLKYDSSAAVLRYHSSYNARLDG